MINAGGRGFLGFFFLVRFKKKKIKNGSIADRHLSVGSVNNTKTPPNSLLVEEVSFSFFVGSTPFKTP